jgi:FKBP-type peptidyl-prolyl cis-trans isomerase
MKLSVSQKLVLPVTLLSLIMACKSKSKDGFDLDSTTGVQSHFFTQNSGDKPKLGDIATLELTMKNSKDSMFFNSAHRPGEPDSVKTVRIHLKDSYKGCLALGVITMSVGDSASFLVSADSLYHKTFQAIELPPYIQPGSMVTCNVKLVKFETAEQAKTERESRMKSREAEIAARKTAEPDAIIQYLKSKNSSAKPEADGMYILSDEKGKGKGISEGDSVEVEYTASLLDGTVVEQSNHGEGRTSYFVCYKKEQQLKGLDDALGMMKEGEKLTAVFPSALAFGDQQQGPLILPYTPLVFEIKVVKVKKA